MDLWRVDGPALGGHGAWGDAVDADAKRCPFDGHRGTECHDPGTRGVGVRDLVQAARRDHDADDAAAAGAALPVARRRLHHGEAAGEIGVDDGLPGALAELERRARILTAGAVDEQIAGAEAADDLRKEGRNRRALADVEGERRAFQAARAERTADCRELLGAAPADHHLGTQARGEPRGGTADAAAAARDHYHRAIEELRRERARLQRQGFIRHAERAVHSPRSSLAMMSLRTSEVPAPISSSLLARNRRFTSASQM